VERVLVIGSGGAGKTTLSLALAEVTGLPVIHLDEHYWRDGWAPTAAAEWQEKVQELVRAPRWIMDGNYGGTLPLRLEAADTIVFLDVPRARCVWRVLRRGFRYRGRSRPSLPPGCRERVTLEFLSWIWSYPRRRRPDILARLEAVSDRRHVVVLHGDEDVRRFLRLALAGGAPHIGNDGQGSKTNSRDE